MLLSDSQENLSDGDDLADLRDLHIATSDFSDVEEETRRRVEDAWTEHDSLPRLVQASEVWSHDL